MLPRLMWIAWPAFLAACALELLVFAFVDPMELDAAGQPPGWPRQGVYTLAFFAFWGVSFAACALATLLRMTPQEINACPFEPAHRRGRCPRNGRRA